jgi:hypothetical protein
MEKDTPADRWNIGRRRCFSCPKGMDARLEKRQPGEAPPVQIDDADQ